VHFEPALRVISGNYVTAKRRGVLEGVDFGFTGEVGPRGRTWKRALLGPGVAAHGGHTRRRTWSQRGLGLARGWLCGAGDAGSSGCREQGGARPSQGREVCHAREQLGGS
jgi:hypothetical protein